MKKSQSVVVLLVLAGAIGFSGIAAAEENQSLVLEHHARSGYGIVELAKKFTKPMLQQPVPLPTPIDPSVSTSRGFVTSDGPEASADLGRSVGLGASALVSARGGGFSSPRQRADREIQLLIKRLD